MGLWDEFKRGADRFIPSPSEFVPSLDEVGDRVARFIPGRAWENEQTGPGPATDRAGKKYGPSPSHRGVNTGRHGVAPAAVRFVRSQNPELSRKEAARLVKQFRVQQKNPGLAEFVQSQTNKVDPNTMQMFFQQTVAPYLKQTSQQYQQGAQAGTNAMQSILAGAAPSPAIDVLKSFLPLQQAGNMQMGAALEGAAITAPYYDQLMSQLQENIAQQQRTQFYNQQTAAGVPSSSSSDIDPAMAALVAEATK